MTAGERTLWAEAREKYFSTGVNRTSLEVIEKAAFVLILDDEEYEIGIVCVISNLLFKTKFLSIQSIQSANSSGSSSTTDNEVINLYIAFISLSNRCTSV